MDHSEAVATSYSLGESEEDYLRSIWQKLNVGKDGYLDKTQLALVCECIGMEKVSDEVITQLFDKLDLDRDGRISFEEFLHLFQNGRPGNFDTSAAAHNTAYVHEQWNPVRNAGTTQRPDVFNLSNSSMTLFAAIDPTNTQVATYDATVDMLQTLGIPRVANLLEALGFRPTQKVFLRDLISALQDELNAGLEAGILTNIGHAGIAFHAATVIMQQELLSLRASYEHISHECDKVRSDLLEANQRASLLAQEVDENHVKQEAARQLQIKQLEQRHSEQVRLIQDEAHVEREQLSTQLQKEMAKLQRQIDQLKEEESRLKGVIDTLNEDNGRLTTENTQLSEQLANTERANGLLMRELSGVSLARDTMVEWESHRQALEQGERHSLTEQISRLSAENLQLRDRNDELLAEIESLRAKVAAVRSTDVKLGTTSWKSEPTVLCGVKRRSESAPEDPEEAEDSVDESRVGKVRKTLETGNHEPVANSDTTNDEALRNCDSGTNGDQQSIAAQLQQAKQGTTIKEQLKRVFEKLRLQIVEEFLEDDDSAAALQRHYHKVLRQQEDRHFDEKRAMIENHLLKQSALEAQLAELHMRYEDLAQLQKVMEVEHEMELSEMRSQLKRAHAVKDFDDLNNLTEALADLDAALELELNKDGGLDEPVRHEADDKETPKEKVQQLERHCKSLETELDCVKVKIVKIVSDNEALRKKVKTLEEELDSEKRSAKDLVDKKVEFETALLQQRIKQLVRDGEQEKQRALTEKQSWDEERRDFESRLELMRNEFDRLDEYWQNKIDEERELYEKDRELTDDRFRDLEAKIKEYEELLSHTEDSSTSSLSTIEERSNWEKQLNDLEDECQLLRTRVTQLEECETRVESLRSELDSCRVEAANYKNLCDRLTEELDQHKGHEEQLKDKLAQLYFGKPSRPLSPPPKPGLLPPGYSPLKSKGWARPARSLPDSPSRSLSLDKGDSKCQKSGPVSLNSGYPEPQHRACRVDLSVLQALNSRLKQQEQRCRELQAALKHQQLRTDRLLLEIKSQHDREVRSLEIMTKTAQETLRQMTVKNQHTMDKLSASELLIVQLYTENANLLRALQLQSTSNSSTSN